MFNVIVLNVIMLSVVAPSIFLFNSPAKYIVAIGSEKICQV
jgi:hypothetical protein